MKSFFTTMAVLSMVLCACSTDDERFKADSQMRHDAFVTYDDAFKKCINGTISTRSSIIESDNQVYDSLMALSGRDFCEKIKVPTDVLLNSFGLTDQLLLETYREYEDSLQNATTFEEYKCFTALALYDVYKTEGIQIPTRANAQDYVSCIALGVTYNELAKSATKKIAKFAVKKLASRLVPYIGWGWAVAEAAECISGL